MCVNSALTLIRKLCLHGGREGVDAGVSRAVGAARGDRAVGHQLLYQLPGHPGVVVWIPRSKHDSATAAPSMQELDRSSF